MRRDALRVCPRTTQEAPARRFLRGEAGRQAASRPRRPRPGVALRSTAAPPPEQTKKGETTLRRARRMHTRATIRNTTGDCSISSSSTGIVKGNPTAYGHTHTALAIAIRPYAVHRETRFSQLTARARTAQHQHICVTASRRAARSAAAAEQPHRPQTEADPTANTAHITHHVASCVQPAAPAATCPRRTRRGER